MYDLMPIERCPDWEMRLKRQDAFWQNEIIDRPVVNITLWKENPDYPWPAPKSDVREAWLDAEYVAQRALAASMMCVHLGDALPSSYPNLGPEVFSAFFGCELGFGESTSWSEPILEEWSNVDNVRFSEDNFYWKKLIELTDAYLEVGRGKFYTGLTDFHPGGDAITAFRDPLRMNMDMIDHADEVKSMLGYVTETYFKVYDYFYNKLIASGQAISTWPGIVSSKKWYVPSNDFSCMVSKEMFDDIFLPGIIDECRHMEASIYHLDGPDALRHLDSLLEIKELNAIQWVHGAGHGRASDWMDVYKKCQSAGKGLQLGLEPNELDFFIENLRPEGLWIGVLGVEDEEQAETIIKKIAAW